MGITWKDGQRLSCWPRGPLTWCCRRFHMASDEMRERLLYTIGYEASLIDDFISTLRAARVDLVIDVRELPISRKRGFSKTALANRLDEAGVSYLHLKGLGDPKAGRIAAREGRYADFHRVFSCQLMTDSAKKDLQTAVSQAEKRVACLMCFEKNHRNCHRLMVADAMNSQSEFEIIHLQVGSGLLAAGPTSDPHARREFAIG